jgi:hypothetical protein
VELEPLYITVSLNYFFSYVVFLLDLFLFAGDREVDFLSSVSN